MSNEEKTLKGAIDYMQEVSDDAKEALASVTKRLAEIQEAFDRAHGELAFGGEIRFPITVTNIEYRSDDGDSAKVGKYVSIRPAAGEKTYLGIYLGDLMNGAMLAHSTKSGTLFASLSHNPAIWVPDLNRVVWGNESWWGVISSPDQLREITDADIENIWYVQALRALEANQAEREKEDEDDTND